MNSLKKFSFTFLIIATIYILFQFSDEQSDEMKSPTFDDRSFEEPAEFLVEKEMRENNKNAHYKEDNLLISYQKNGITYFEAPGKELLGGLSNNFKKLKSDADGGDSHAAYLLGVNLERCLNVPENIDSLRKDMSTLYDSSSEDGSEGADFAFSEEKALKDFYYCEGVPDDEKLRYYKYIKLSIAGGNVFAASENLDFYYMVKTTHSDAPPGEQERILNTYIEEHRDAMKNAAKHGSIQAMLNLGQYSINVYNSSQNKKSAIESLAYYLVLKEYAENDILAYVGRKIESQTNLLSSQEVSAAHLESIKLKSIIEKNKTIYKLGINNH